MTGSKKPYIHIKAPHWKIMHDHVSSVYPEEGCGLVAGTNNLSHQVFLITNKLRSPYSFYMEPQELINALEIIDQNNWDLLAIFHSHPHGPDHPSYRDAAEHQYPNAASLIWFPERINQDQILWNCKAYQFHENNFIAIEIELG